MKMLESIIVWNPKTGEIKIGVEQAKILFIDFHTIVVRDGVSPQDAHREFLKIDEYREFISPDIDGADP